jgi:hypothetical protein
MSKCNEGKRIWNTLLDKDVGLLLPLELKVNIAPPPNGTYGAYSPKDNQITVALGAKKWTILHEGAHAEHCQKANIIGVKFLDDSNFRLGYLIMGEAYVGYRLGRYNEFVTIEQNTIQSTCSTVHEWVACNFSCPAEIKGSGYDGSMETISAIKHILKIMPIIVAEQRNDNRVFSVDLFKDLSGVGHILLSIMQVALSWSTLEADLIDSGRMIALGTFIKQQFQETWIV